MSDIKENIGFIGGGEMAYAIVMGMISGGVSPSLLYVSNPSANKLNRFEKAGAKTTSDNMKVFTSCSIIVLCVKPQIYPHVLKEMKDNNFCENNQLIISVIAGLKSSAIEKDFPRGRVVRTMPNTPCLVKAGIVLYCESETSTKADLELTKKLLSPCAEVIMLPERLIDAGQAISGCGPAYLYMAMEALSDGGVKMGLPRATSLKLAAAALVGSGKMHLETGLHPGQLKDAVTSPGGVTIRAVHALEKAGFRSALIDAVEVAVERSLEISEGKM